jgi:adenylylsulfate kinase
MKDNSPVIWLTGMSGAGKTTLANLIDSNYKQKGYSVVIIDGDSVRDRDNVKLGFGLDDVRINNMRIASLCNEYRANFDIVIVPVISPYEEVREIVRKILSPNFHLVYLKANIGSLRDRDTKGLYAAADCGDIVDLIGYSSVNPYNKPHNPELIISTANSTSENNSFNMLANYIDKVIFDK